MHNCMFRTASILIYWPPLISHQGIEGTTSVIWRGKYVPSGNESKQSTLRRCYSELLTFRNERYTLISDCELDYYFHHCTKTSLNELLEIVGNTCD